MMSSCTSGRGGRGQREHRRALEPLRDRAQHHVVRAKVVSPLGNTVGFVYHEQGNLALEQDLEEVPVAKALGGDVEDLSCALLDGQLGCGLLAAGQRGVDGPGVHPDLVELVGLIFHQRDQGRHHQGQARQEQRRQLVGQRLARAGRHHREHITTVENRPDDRFLPKAELFETEARPEGGADLPCGSCGAGGQGNALAPE